MSALDESFTVAFAVPGVEIVYASLLLTSTISNSFSNSDVVMPPTFAETLDIVIKEPNAAP